MLAPLTVLAAAGYTIYSYTADPSAETNRQNLARGADYVLHGGDGYVWTDAAPRLNTGNTEPPPAYQPLGGTDQQTIRRGEGIFAFPGTGPGTCAASGGFDLSPEQQALQFPFPLDPPQGPVVFAASMSKQLDQNMQAARIPKPPGTAAHHIVAWDDKRAAVSRAILAAAGIGINDAINGVYLPQNKRFFTIGGVWHSDIHTNDYHREVERRLSSVPASMVSSVLWYITQEILQGTFPK